VGVAERRRHRAREQAEVTPVRGRSRVARCAPPVARRGRIRSGSSGRGLGSPWRPTTPTRAPRAVTGPDLDVHAGREHAQARPGPLTCRKREAAGRSPRRGRGEHAGDAGLALRVQRVVDRAWNERGAQARCRSPRPPPRGRRPRADGEARGGRRARSVHALQHSPRCARRCGRGTIHLPIRFAQARSRPAETVWISGGPTRSSLAAAG